MNALLLAAVTLVFSFGDVKVDCPQPGDWVFSVVREVETNDVESVKIVLDAPAVTNPPKFTVEFAVPQVDIHSKWRSNGWDDDYQLMADWGCWMSTELAKSLPLYCYKNNSDRNRLTLALSECARRVEYWGGIREEGSMLTHKLLYFSGTDAPIRHYETSVRIDRADKPFADAVREATEWMVKTAGVRPMAAPEAAFEPLYSTWYDFHQELFDKDIEAECAIASRLGMKTLIVDDGWQTDDHGRGYAYTGDWEYSTNRFPNLPEHVKKVQAMGMKYMMWFSVPFVGVHSRAYLRFKDKLMEEREDGTCVFDPRFPEVRDYLVGIYVRAVRDWGLDGLKLDFIDQYSSFAKDPAPAQNYRGRDIRSVPEAVDVLMKRIVREVQAIKPEILIEFRQDYTGPMIRQYGNMLRVCDCPGNARQNRLAIANIRLTSGDSAVHSDMLEWNFKETPEQAAQYVLDSIFGVIQYSVMLREAPASHLAMIHHWIDFSRAHRETLLKGRFTPHHPELMYPQIDAESAAERIIGVYNDGQLVNCGSMDKPVYVLNATGSAGLTLKLASRATVTSYDTFGEKLTAVSVEAGVSAVDCPMSGYVLVKP